MTAYLKLDHIDKSFARGNQLSEVSTASGVTGKYWYDDDGNLDCVTFAAGSQADCSPSTQTTPSANALATTVDLYYEVENHDGKLRPGQRVGVTLPLKGEAESLVVPYASVLYDLNGGAWVYEAMGKHVFARRRIVVDHVVGPEAVLALGPKPGTKVVTDGAAELFGTEFGGGK